MTPTTQAKLPAHLRRYVVAQNYGRYTAEDQAVWRFTMRQLRQFLTQHAHSSYLEGFQKSGLEIESIPHIDQIDAHLEQFGWGAVPVSGFIPPAAFMEFQALGILPIASDMRSIDHLLYTPAPDIVHEAAGHAPILVQPEYGAYLRQYGEVARHSIVSQEDLAQYEAIRALSDLKENPDSTADEIRRCEETLEEINRKMTKVSEAALLSRMNWWTAEYGLIGDLASPKIFGAGLLSSVGEARLCLGPTVRKLPLSVDCVEYSYDITEPQPQLFVARDFAQLGEVLEQLASRLAYRRGGAFGLNRAIDACTVNTVQLNSGLQISGMLTKFLIDESATPVYLQFEGPSQMATNYRELSGQGVERHSHGFSSPVGLLTGQDRCLSEFSPPELNRLGLKLGERSTLNFASGVQVTGQIKDWTFASEKLVIITWQDCTVARGIELLFDRTWGEFDMAVGSTVPSVFGGPADRERFGSTEDFVNKTVPTKSAAPSAIERMGFYQKVRELRGRSQLPEARAELLTMVEEYTQNPKCTWLHGIELLELMHNLKFSEAERQKIILKLQNDGLETAVTRNCVSDGIALAPLIE